LALRGFLDRGPSHGMMADMSQPTVTPVVPEKGWHVLHLFYRIEHGQWAMLTNEERIAAKTALTELIQEIRATEQTQLLVFSIVSPKADIGFMLLTPNLHVANAFEKRLNLGLGPDILMPVFSFLSLTEESEYFSTADEYAVTLQKEQNLQPGSAEYEKAMEDFKTRMVKYAKDKVYPNLPNWEVFCFYPMSKRRQPEQNWYELPFEQRKALMAGHGRVGRQYHGKIAQLITGSTGLDDAEWGVTLFAHDTFYIKDIVYKMRFDAVSVKYAEFGDFYIGLSLPLDELFRRVQI
jgi:peroxiredoxin